MYPHHVKVSLTPYQVKKLQKGKKVRLSYQALSGGDQNIYLTQQQFRKVQTRLKKQVGADIGPFDQSQLKHHLQHGGGFWDSLKSVGKAALELAKEHALPLAKEHLLPIVVEEGKNMLKKEVIPKVKKALVGRAGGMTKKEMMQYLEGQYGSGIFDWIGSIFGLGLNPKKKVKKEHLQHAMNIQEQKGAGFLSNIVKGLVKNVVKEIPIIGEPLSSVSDVGVDLVGNMLGVGVKGGNKKQKRKQTGGSFRLPGLGQP